MRKQVFISYRHESPEHAADVRRLGTILREAKIPVELDQFFQDDHPGGPDAGGWTKWSEDSANECECVLIVASEGWFAAYEKRGDPGSGLGAATEADLFRQALWDEHGHNARIRVAFLHAVLADRVPVRLRAWHQFRPFERAGELKQLIRWIGERLGVEAVEPPSVVWPAPVEFQTELADRKQKEWPAIVDLLTGRSGERILLMEGGSGVGKSELMRQAKAYAKRLGLVWAHIDFKGGGLNTEAVLGEIDRDIGGHLPNFSRDGANKTHLLRKDLRGLRRPALLIFDTYEAAADNKPVADWLNQQLLSEVETSAGLAVIVAGQKVPERANAGWRDMARHLVLEPITEVAAWEDWVSRQYPGFHEKGDLRTLVKASSGSPLLMTTLCARVAQG